MASLNESWLYTLFYTLRVWSSLASKEIILIKTKKTFLPVEDQRVRHRHRDVHPRPRALQPAWRHHKGAQLAAQQLKKEKIYLELLFY